MVARISDDYRPQLPVVGKNIPEPAVPYHVGTTWLEETVNIRTRSVRRAVRHPYSDSEESDNDVVYTEEYDSELQQISLRNEWPTQTTVDSCGERCAQLDDFKWFLPTYKRAEDLRTPESEIDTSDSENGVDLIDSDSPPLQTESATQQLLRPPVVAQTRPKEGCHAAAQRRLRRGRDVRTADNTVAADARQESSASDTVVSRKIHRKSECVTTIAPGLAAAPQAAYEIVQPRRPDYSYTNPLPLGSGCLVAPRCDTPEGSPPAEMNISKSLDSLQTEISVMSTEMAGGSPPVDLDILVTPDTLQTEVSVMAVMSEKWMQRFVISPQVLCSDGFAPDDDPARRSSDVGSDAGIIQDAMPTVVSVRTVVAEEWMDWFAVDLVECLSVSRTSAVARTFGPPCLRSIPLLFLLGGGGTPWML